MLKEEKHPVHRMKLTFAQKAADLITDFGGSWMFIFIFIFFLIIWIIVNSLFLVRYVQGNPWDPYPFILLNLILSSLAAFQAPIILMSQNRKGQTDRLRAEYDYKVNKLAEREIRELKEDIKFIKIKLNK